MILLDPPRLSSDQGADVRPTALLEPAAERENRTDIGPARLARAAAGRAADSPDRPSGLRASVCRQAWSRQFYFFFEPNMPADIGRSIYLHIYFIDREL
mmetsp:Transcript_252/g.724  ORF Transcript_252/g.724 Transcript_252/m.724 type:complete len:99 (-) Transcript_252:7-303(-)